MTDEKAEQYLRVAEEKVRALPTDKDKLAIAVQLISEASKLLDAAWQEFGLTDQLPLPTWKRRKLHSSVRELKAESKNLEKIVFFIARHHKDMTSVIGHLGDTHG